MSFDDVKGMMERIDAENEIKSTVKITLDKSNKVSFPGFKYLFEALGEKVLVSIDVYKSGYECQKCKGKKTVVVNGLILNCDACDGKGAILHLPDDSKKLPTTGVVVSMGRDCNQEKLGYKVGDRIIFGPYAGSMIPTKAGLMFKIIDASQAWCTIEGGEDLAAFDFILQE